MQLESFNPSESLHRHTERIVGKRLKFKVYNKRLFQNKFLCTQDKLIMTKEDLNVLNYLHPLCYIVTQRSLSTGKGKKISIFEFRKKFRKNVLAN